MKKTETKLCINHTETIGDFNYAFTAALLRKLKGTDVHVFPVAGSSDEGYILPITSSVIAYLCERTKFPLHVVEGVSSPYVNYGKLGALIAHTEEFLAIFEVKK